MCGLVGIVSSKQKTEYQKRKSYISTALFLDTIRGTDSTGVAAMPFNTNDEVFLYKKALPAPDFLQLRVLNKFLMNCDHYSAVIGHNRAATRGTVNAANAHPFRHEHIVLAHNGTLAATNDGTDGNHPVDSARIAETMATRGEKETLERLNGAYALMWINTQTNTFNIARNSERPMWFAFSTDNKTVMFASEWWMVDVAADRAGYFLDEDSVWEIEEGKWLSFSLDQDSFAEHDVEDFKIYVPPKTTKYLQPYNQRAYQGNTESSSSQYSTQRRKEQEGALKSLGLNLDMEVTVYPTGVEEYTDLNTKKPTGRGCLAGFIEEAPGYVMCRAHACLLKDYDEIEQAGTGKGIISGIQWDKTLDNGEGDWVVHLSKIWVNENERGSESWVKDYGQGFKELETEDDLFRPEDITLPGPTGVHLHYQSWLSLVKEGCAYCGDPVQVKDADYLVWTHEYEPICWHCQNAEWENIKDLVEAS